MEVHYITINAVDSQPVDVDSLLFNENDTTTDLLRHVEQMRSTSGQRYSPFRIQKLFEGDRLPYGSLEFVSGVVPDWCHFVGQVTVEAIEDPLSMFAHEDQICLLVICDVTEPERLPSIIEDHDARLRTNRQGQSLHGEELVIAIRRIAERPSNAAKNKAMMATQKLTRLDAIRNGRPLHLSGPPISLYHSVFAKFRSGVASTPDIASNDDLKWAYELMEASSRYYDTEEQRYYAIKRSLKMLIKSYPHKMNFYADGQSFEPDMHRDAPCGLFEGVTLGVTGLCSLLLEVENDLGSGSCNAMDEVAKDYMLMSTNPMLSELRKRSCLPSFLVSVVGGHLVVAGAIFLDGVVTQPLTPIISLAPPLVGVNFNEHLRYVAHLLMTLRDCVDDLDRYYVSIKPEDVGTRTEQRLYIAPCIQSLPHGSGNIHLEYLDRMRDINDPRAVFLAQAIFPTDAAVPVKCIVKFTEQYNDEAHKKMQTSRVAAPLLHCSWQPSLGLFCVVTKYIEKATAPRISAEGAAALRKAIESLHEEGLVFGDLRKPNVILDKDGWPHLVDFDWCGAVGQVRYPFDLNKSEEIGWAAGVYANGLIAKEHDLYMLEKYLSEVKTQ